MKYDDASWHYGGDFPKGLPNEAGATHIGMFVVWALLNDLGGEIHYEQPAELDALKSRAVTPGAFFMQACDEKFIDEDLSEEGNAFALDYYDGDDAPYVDDYLETLVIDKPSVYHVTDSWENYDLLSPIMDARFEAWKNGD